MQIGDWMVVDGRCYRVIPLIANVYANLCNSINTMKEQYTYKFVFLSKYCNTSSVLSRVGASINEYLSNFFHSLS